MSPRSFLQHSYHKPIGHYLVENYPDYRDHMRWRYYLPSSFLDYSSGTEKSRLKLNSYLVCRESSQMASSSRSKGLHFPEHTPSKR